MDQAEHLKCLVLLNFTGCLLLYCLMNMLKLLLVKITKENMKILRYLLSLESHYNLEFKFLLQIYISKYNIY